MYHTAIPEDKIYTLCWGGHFWIFFKIPLDFSFISRDPPGFFSLFVTFDFWQNFKTSCIFQVFKGYAGNFFSRIAHFWLLCTKTCLKEMMLTGFVPIRAISRREHLWKHTIWWSAIRTIVTVKKAVLLCSILIFWFYMKEILHGSNPKNIRNIMV